MRLCLAALAIFFRCLAGLSLLFFMGCAGTMRAPERVEREEVRSFVMDARFSVRAEPGSAQQEVQGVSGRLLWRHQPKSDHIVFSNPLGQGQAELHSAEGGATLRLASGEEKHARNAAALLQDVFTHPLPVTQIPFWLLGRAGKTGRLSRDGLGRPLLLTEEGWNIEYRYDDETAGALPSRLIVQHDGVFELRLRIEEWQIDP